MVHPLMSPMGGGERLCCETRRAARSFGHEVVLLSEEFDPHRLETFFGFDHLFERVEVRMYRRGSGLKAGLYGDLLRRLRRQERLLPDDSTYDLVFSTQDAGYIPDVSKAVIQWGYFPNPLPRGIYGWPARQHYRQKIRRIGLVLAISEYSKKHLDQAWNVSSRVVYPACNLIRIGGPKENLVVTAARAVPEKRLEIFWKVARQSPGFRFTLLLTVDPRFSEYAREIALGAPDNARVLVNPGKDLYHKTLSSARVYLHLMEGEHFGITVVEAMSAGCVPVVHDSGGPKEIVDNCGFLWRNWEDIPSLLITAMESSGSLSNAAKARADSFSRERFDGALAEVLGRGS